MARKKSPQTLRNEALKRFRAIADEAFKAGQYAASLRSEQAIVRLQELDRSEAPSTPPQIDVSPLTAFVDMDDAKPEAVIAAIVEALEALDYIAWEVVLPDTATDDDDGDDDAKSPLDQLVARVQRMARAIEGK